MLRQVRRKIKRVWDKVPCFSVTDKVDVVGLPHTAVDVFFKVSEGLLLRYNLDMFMRWRLYPYVGVDGFFFGGFHFDLGVASDEWLDDYFGDSDSDFEF
jgi:hypothetical protein